MNNKKDVVGNAGTDAPKETPSWEKALYSEERRALLAQGQMNLREFHAITGPEMLQMAEFGFRMYEQGRNSEAKTIFSGLIQLEPTHYYYYTALGAVHLREESWDLARAMFDMAIVLNPKDIASYVNRGEVNLRDGKIADAAQDFSDAVKLDPQFKDPLTQRARVLAAAAVEMVEAAQKKLKGEKNPPAAPAPAPPAGPAPRAAPAPAKKKTK